MTDPWRGPADSRTIDPNVDVMTLDDYHGDGGFVRHRDEQHHAVLGRSSMVGHGVDVRRSGGLAPHDFTHPPKPFLDPVEIVHERAEGDPNAVRE